MDQEKRRGRPTQYKPEYAEQAAKLCKLGAIDRQLADFFNVSEVTINAWKKEHPIFLKSIEKAKLDANAEVEKSLFKRACGYKVKETKFASYEGKITDSVEYEKELPPDTAAAFIWLKNRDPKRWRDRQEVKHEGAAVTFTVVRDGYSQESIGNGKALPETTSSS